MKRSIREVAALFVDSVRDPDWQTVTQIPPGGRELLLEVVVAAGFDANAIELGKLEGTLRDIDGPCGKYPINKLCPFKVKGPDGDNRDATGWLDCALRYVLDALARGVDPNEITSGMDFEIRRSVPLKPIQLTIDGDFLREDAPSLANMGYGYFVDHTLDTQELSCCVGLHQYCNGYMDRKRATADKDCLVCRSCHLRVLFPKTVVTYGGLREALAQLATP